MTDPASRFSDRTVLVVGGAHGIGRATAERFASEGAAVVVADLDAGEASRTRDALPGPGEHRSVGVDITDAASVAAAFRELGDLPLHVVAHTAGGARPHGPFEEIDDEEWIAMTELNLVGAARIAKGALPLLRRTAGDRAMVFVSSVNGLRVIGEEPYSAAKAGLMSLTAQLASRYAPERIRVNAVAPGTVRTRVWDDQEGGADRLRPMYPLGRVGEPSDIAAAIAFLSSEDASWITGHTLPVDGGLAVARPGGAPGSW